MKKRGTGGSGNVLKKSKAAIKGMIGKNFSTTENKKAIKCYS